MIVEADNLVYQRFTLDGVRKWQQRHVHGLVHQRFTFDGVR